MLFDNASRTVQSVDTAFSLIALLQNYDGATISDLSRELDLAKSTIHNYLGTLQSMGYVVEESGTYRLGLHFLTHGMAARNRFRIDGTIRPVLADIAEEIDNPVWWLVEEFGRGYFIDRALPAGEKPVYGRIGKRSYLHTHAPGKALLAIAPQEHVRDVIAQHGLESFTRETTIDEDRLLQECATVRERGYAVTRDEPALGIQSFGVAFEGPQGHHHALGVFGFSHSFSGEIEGNIPRILQNRASDIEAELTDEMIE